MAKEIWVRQKSRAKEHLNVLLIADIVGKPGRLAVFELLEGLKTRYNVDLVIANAENAAGGLGCTPELACQLLRADIDVLTMGNHVWDKKELIEFISLEPRIVRPANFPPEAPGLGHYIIEKKGLKVGIILVQGRVFMECLDCPFRAVDRELAEVAPKADLILVEVHAEATAEKLALAHYLDSRVGVVFGTHTHIATSDLGFLPGGTLYITDLGMTGPLDSVIGVKKELVIRRFITGLPVRFEVAREDVRLQGLLIGFSQGGKVISARFLEESLPPKEGV